MELPPADGAFTPEQAALAALDDNGLRAVVVAAQAAQVAQAASVVEADAAEMAALERQRVDAERRAETYKNQGEASSRLRHRALSEAASYAFQRATVAARALFREADGFTAAFGGGGVTVGVGELGEDSLAAGFEVVLSPASDCAPPTLKVWVGAPGGRDAKGRLPEGGAKVAMRLSKLSVRGDTPVVPSLDAERVSVALDFTLAMSAVYDPALACWRPGGDGVRLEVHRLQQRCDGGLAFADSGLPLPELPEGLIRLLLNLLLPRAAEEAVNAMPAEAGEYLMAAAVPLTLHGSVTSAGTTAAIMDANLCEAPGTSDKAAAAEEARLLSGVADVAAAKLLASALVDWKALGIPVGPPAERKLGLGGGPSDQERRSRVSLQALTRYSAHIAALGTDAEAAMRELWRRAMRRRSSGEPPVCVGKSLAYARRLSRKPVSAGFRLHALQGGLNAHAALRACVAAHKRLGLQRPHDERLAGMLFQALDAAAANVHSARATLHLRLARDELSITASECEMQCPLAAAAAAYMPDKLASAGASWDMRRAAFFAITPPTPAMVRITGGDAALSADELVAAVRMEAFCPHSLCAAFDADDSGLPGEEAPGAAPDAYDTTGAPLRRVFAAEAAGLSAALLIDPVLLAAETAADGSSPFLPAVTLRLERGTGGPDAVLRCCTGARSAFTARRLHVDAAPCHALRTAARAAAAIGDGFVAAGHAAPPPAAPVALLLRFLERRLRGISVAAALRLSARAAGGDLVLEAEGAAAEGEEVLALATTFRMQDVVEEGELVALALADLYEQRNLVMLLLPSWLRELPPPPPRAAPKAAVSEPPPPAAEPAAEAGGLADKLGGLLRTATGGGKN